MKRIGTKKEVYLGIALKTLEGMVRDDIIKTVKEKSKKIYLSKNVYRKLKSNNPLILNKKRNFTKKKNDDIGKLNVSDLKEKMNRERKLQRLKRRKLKSLKSKSKCKKGKKLSFALNKNKTREFYCVGLNREDDIFSTSSFNGYERDDEGDDDNIKNEKGEFKIEELPNITLDELFI
jgi:hypothetical protein